MAKKTAWMAIDGVPSVNWLTFVGEPHLAKLGGKSALIRAALLQKVLAVEAGHGVMIQAGDRPRMGETTNPAPGLEPYSAAYELLRAVMYDVV